MFISTHYFSPLQFMEITEIKVFLEENESFTSLKSFQIGKSNIWSALQETNKSFQAFRYFLLLSIVLKLSVK